MEKRPNIKALVSHAEKAASGLLNKAVQAVDQNDNGKLELSDVAAIAGAVGDTVKKGAQAVQESAGEKVRLLELKSLQPIFPDSLSSADFLSPNLFAL